MRLDPPEEAYFTKQLEALDEVVKNTSKLGIAMTRLLLAALLLSGFIGAGSCLVVGHLAYNRGKVDGAEQTRKELENSKDISKKENTDD